MKLIEGVGPKSAVYILELIGEIRRCCPVSREEISFRGISYKGDDNSENIGQLADRSGVVESLSQNFGYVEGTAADELVTRKLVNCGLWHYCWHAMGGILHGITVIPDVSYRCWSTGTLLE